MKKQIRLDKYISEASGLSRSEVKNYLKKGRVMVNSLREKDPGRKVTPEEDMVSLDGTVLAHSTYHYLMLHKPAGVVSATRDDKERTVLDLILSGNEQKELSDHNDILNFKYMSDHRQIAGNAIYKDIFPVGRLDKDTEGLLLMTDDGDLSHRLLSPRKHVDKTYFALLNDKIGQEEIKAFEEGLSIGDEKDTLPALLRPATKEEMRKHAPEGRAGFGVLITIHEGRFHQVKRMAKAVNREVLYLKRVSMGSLKLDETLKAGDFRPLSEEEIRALKI